MAKKEQTVQIEVCDICKAEAGDERHWSENFSGAACDIRQDGYNGIPCKWENLCRPCREALIAAIHDTIAKRQPMPKEKPKFLCRAYVSPNGWSG